MQVSRISNYASGCLSWDHKQPTKKATHTIHSAHCLQRWPGKWNGDESRRLMDPHPLEVKHLAAAPTGKTPVVERTFSHGCCCYCCCCCCRLPWSSSCCIECTGLCALGESRRVALRRRSPASTPVRPKLYDLHGIEQAAPDVGDLSANGRSNCLHWPPEHRPTFRMLSRNCCCCRVVIVNLGPPPLLHPPSMYCST